MRIHGTILEALQSAKNDVLTSYKGYNENDIFKILKDCVLGRAGELVYLFRAREEIKTIKLLKMKKGEDPKKIPITATRNAPPISYDEFDELISSKSLLPVKSESDQSTGDIDVEEIKDMVKNMELPKVLGQTINQIVKSHGHAWIIELGMNKDIQKEYYPRIEKALANRGISIVRSYYDGLKAGNLTRVVIHKVQYKGES